MPTPTRLIRNFSIIAHIDHGKSTLADRLLDATGALSDRERKAQFLDSMDLERERGITIKAATVRLALRGDGRPDLRAQPHRHARARRLSLRGVAVAGRLRGRRAGRRRVAGRRGADARQRLPGREQQPHDRPGDQQDRPARRRSGERPPADRRGDRHRRVRGDPGVAPRRARASTRSSRPSSPRCRRRSATPTAPLKVLLLDSWYDTYRGVVILVRVVDGVLRPKQKVRFMAARRDYEVQTIGAFAPFPREVPELAAGEVGFFTAAIKEVARRARRRHHHRRRPTRRRAAARLPARQADGVRRHLPDRLGALRRTCATRWTSCGSTTRRSRASPRRRRRWGSASAAASWACCTWRSCRSASSASTTSTSSPPRRPSASAACCKNGDVIELDNPAKFPSEGDIDRIEEPIIAVTIHTPPEYVGGILKLCEEKRGTQTGLTYAGEKRVIIRYDLPLTEMVFGFYDRLKSVLARLRLARLRAQGLPRRRPGAHGPDGQRRPRRLAVAHRPPRGRPTTRAATCA